MEGQSGGGGIRKVGHFQQCMLDLTISILYNSVIISFKKKSSKKASMFQVWINTLQTDIVYNKISLTGKAEYIYTCAHFRFKGSAIALNVRTFGYKIYLHALRYVDIIIICVEEFFILYQLSLAWEHNELCGDYNGSKCIGNDSFLWRKKACILQLSILTMSFL